LKHYPYKQKKLKARNVTEHRWRMEMHVGRRLGRFEFVHHINGDKRDNRLDNLEIVTPKEHAQRHGQQKYPLTKVCLVCAVEFTPHPTKRARAKTCSPKCRYELLALTNMKPDRPHSRYRVDAYPCEKKARMPVAVAFVEAAMEVLPCT
jgi:hypothetical protein